MGLNDADTAEFAAKPPNRTHPRRRSSVAIQASSGSIATVSHRASRMSDAEA